MLKFAENITNSKVYKITILVINATPPLLLKILSSWRILLSTFPRAIFMPDLRKIFPGFLEKYF